MSNDSEKIRLFKEVSQTQDSARSFEIVSLALAIHDDEDRDLYLFDAVRWLIENGVWQKAYGAAHLMSESYEKSQALREIADYLALIGHLGKAFSIFAEAEKSAAAESLAGWQKAELLHHVAKSLRRAKAFFMADEIWEKAVAAAQKGEKSASSQDSRDASGVLAEIAENFAAEERIEKALSLAQKIKDIGCKEKVLQQISTYSQSVKKVA